MVSSQKQSFIDPIRHSVGEVATICLPGILASAKQQFRPLENLLPPGLVVGMDTSNHEAIARQIEEYRTQGFAKILLVGASMGGMRVPFVVEEFRKMCPLETPEDWLSTIIIDAPTGIETMKELPGALRRIVISPIWGPIIGSVIVSSFLKGPNDSEIMVPTLDVRRRLGFTGEDTSDEAWRRHVYNKAIVGMSGFSGQQLYEPTSWIVRVGDDGSLKRATNSLDGVRSTYLACTHPGNVTVAQPEASLWWRAFAGTKVVAVDAVHCGFLQQYEAFVPALREAMSI